MKNNIRKKLSEFFKALPEKWGTLSKQNKATIILSVAAAAVILVSGVVLISSLGKKEDVLGKESTEETETYAVEVFETEEIRETETTEMQEVIQNRTVSLVTSSIEKDLKIKIVDENNLLVTGQVFVVTVKPEGKETGIDYTDDDMDGIIYINSIAAGNYTVFLQEKEGIIVTENSIIVKVKEKIEYKTVEIKNEIKTESQVNVSKEDTSKKNVKEEAEVLNTLPLLESKVYTTEVKKGDVNLADFPNAVVSSDKVTLELTNGAANDVAESIKTATVSLPKSVTLYPAGKDASKMAELLLSFKDTSGIVNTVEWSIDNTDVVDFVLADDNMSASLTGKAKGKATITVSISYEVSKAAEETGSEISEEAVTEISTGMQTQTMTCEVTVSDYTEDKTQLKDMSGNLLYADSNATRIATQKDYVDAEIFYTNPKYIGWQTFDGNLYYFKEDYTPATGRQIIDGRSYDFYDNGIMVVKEQTTGIDVSKWQGTIDWKAVADSGVDFAIIRCAYRGSDSGVIVEDPCFKKNIAGATKYGIRVGVYFFSQAITEAEAVEEASTAISLVSGYNLDYPIFIDSEESGSSNGRADKLSKTKRTAIVKAFCETVKNAGYKPGVYASTSWYNDNLYASQLDSYCIWVAQYKSECTYTGRYDIWQYTRRGKIAGIKEKVDMDICYTKF